MSFQSTNHSGLSYMKHSLQLLAITAMGGIVFGDVHPASATPALTPGMSAPTLDVGTGAVQKGTVQYSNSIGTSDTFSVGAMTNVGASANASSTPDYNVTSKATFGISGSTVTQKVGGWSTDGAIDSNNDGGNSSVTGGTATDIIKGSFNKETTRNDVGEITGTTNTVQVNGIGTDAKVNATSSSFTTDIAKGGAPIVNGEGQASTSAGTANGGASGSVGTTASTSANNTSFVSSFAQAY